VGGQLGINVVVGVDDNNDNKGDVGLSDLCIIKSRYEAQ
jgi:hypothetical protein